MFKPFLKSTVGVMAALCVSSVAAAQQDTARIFVPFAAGVPIDVSARVLAEPVKEDLGTVIVENKPGAGGNIGVDYVAKSDPDGKTIGIATLASHAVNPWLFSDMPFDAATDFEAVSLMVLVPNVLVMNKEHADKQSIDTLDDLI